jgi:hypothetical protein
MEELIISIEGKNTGKKTLLINLCSITKSIKYSSNIHLIKFIGKKLGSQYKYNKLRNIGIINGKHEQKQIQKYIFEYIELFSMCPRCRLPSELKIKPPIKCKVCSWTPNNNNKKKKGKNEKRKKNQETKEENNDDTDDDTDDDYNNNHKDPISSLNYFLKKNLNASLSDIIEKIKILSIAYTMDRKSQIKMIVYCLAVWTENDEISLIKSFEKYSKIFQMFTLLNNDTEIFLSYIEELIIRRNNGNNLLNKSYKIFGSLYDLEIIDEDEINKWYKSVDDNFIIINHDEAQLIKKKTFPFINWLQFS